MRTPKSFTGRAVHVRALCPWCPHCEHRLGPSPAPAAGGGGGGGGEHRKAGPDGGAAEQQARPATGRHRRAMSVAVDSRGLEMIKEDVGSYKIGA